MNSQLDISNVKFFENEGRAFITGEKSFHILDPSLNGENALLVPYGVKQFGEKSMISVSLPENIREAYVQFENELNLKLQVQVGGFIKGANSFHSNMRTSDEGLSMLGVKLTSDTVVESYDVKKGTWSKLKLDSIPTGCRISLGFTVGHPWKFGETNNVKYGVSLIATDIVVYNDGELKKMLASTKRTIHDLIVECSKKSKLETK